MRLIDADHLRKWIINNWGEGWHGKTVDDIIDQIDREHTFFDDADIVDAEPIRHGYWEFHAKSIKDVPTESCSECGEWSYGDNEAYCPHCGAKMDEVEKKEIKKICILSNGTLKEEYDIPNVIRCKDCKYWKINIIAIPTSEIDRTMYCTRYMWMVHTDADDFCSRGEKKDD